MSGCCHGAITSFSISIKIYYGIFLLVIRLPVRSIVLYRLSAGGTFRVRRRILGSNSHDVRAISPVRAGVNRVAILHEFGLDG